MNRFSQYLILILSICILGCNADPATKTNQSADAVKEKKIFHYNQPKSITSLDPAFARSQTNIWAVDHIFNGLVQLDSDLNVQPAIAESWDISEDGKTYTFQLRDDVYFHDDACFEGGKGRKVNAQDVVYSLNRIIDPAINSPGSWIFKDRIATTNPFVAKDEKTFVLNLKEAFRPMLGIITMQYCSIVPKEAVEKYGKTFRAHPVGTGPFYYKNWKENASLILLKNEHYFEKENGQALPYLDGIRVSFINDRKTAYLELKNGKLDFISGLESSFVNELLDKEGNLLGSQKNKIQFMKAPFLNTEYLGINVDKVKGALAQKKLRQALNYGFDRQQMLKSLRNGVGKPADSGFTPRGLPSYKPAQAPGYSFDPAKARKLLKEAGFPDGKGLPEIKLMTTNNYMDLCTYITRAWEDLGVNVKIELIESATLRQMMTKGQVDFFRASWIADYPDAENYFALFYSKNPAPPNYTRYKNPGFDKLYESALAENDNAKRFDLYHQMDKMIIEDAPVIFLFYDETANFAANGITGFSQNALNILSVKRLKK